MKEWHITFPAVNENDNETDMQKVVTPVEALASADAAARQTRLVEKLQMLGIPEAEMTQSVLFATSALLEKMDDLTRDLTRTKESLSEIERLVDVDCLAPIPNRRAFMRRLSWAITMHERYAHPSTVLYFDINDFKHINDHYGHSAGDLAIRHVAQLLNSTMRESDFVARIGGDEFAVIMYYANEEAGRKRGMKIVEKLAKTPFGFNNRQIAVSAAFGCYTVRSGDDAESCLAAADMAMYVDKRRTKAKPVSV
jgi:diguanylate cyclase (GGDEF)-like protein